MKMKFMATAADKAADKVAEDLEAKRATESHWRLNFRDTVKSQRSADIEVATSYTAFSNLESGRRQFGKRYEPVVEEEEREAQADEDEAPEDMYARRQADKETDRASLRAMKGMTSLSGGPASGKRKSGGQAQQNSSAKKKRNK